jgi:tRNA/rRNA methyltransferase
MPASPERAALPPAIVLVRPQLGENIGKAARAMLNFGLTEMRLVAPRDGWPNPSAGPAAAGADTVLEQARVFDTLAEAVADCADVYATTVRKRGVSKPVVTPEVAARQIHAAPGKAAIVFGPERSGLETDEVALARSILTVPINPAFASLNLAQAVILIAYDWRQALGGFLVQPRITTARLADAVAVQGVLDHWQRTLVDIGFLDPAVPRKLMPGTRLVRDWHGVGHTVVVLEDGFEYGGRRWSSLTAIARAITGSHWNGPRFFGLSRQVRR